MRHALTFVSRPRAERARMALIVLAAAALALGASASAGSDNGSAAAGPIPATVALDWNANAVAAVRAATTMNGVPSGSPARTLFQSEGFLYMSYVQAAVYDAVTKIAHRYEPYHRFSAAAGNASPEAAVVAAAYSTLKFYLGDPGGVLAAKYAASLAAFPDDATTARGIAVGEAAAADIESLRASDGRNAVTPVFGAPGPVLPGAWQVVPPFAVAQTPWLASVTPWMLNSPSQFRAPPPPALTSTQYAADFNETKAYGSLTSSVRTPAQTAIAYFWNANVINQQNQLYRDVAAQHNLDLVDTTRLLAMGEMTVTDASIACFDSKYHYLHWRPYTAIRNADIDGNPATTADPAWTPLLSTPNHPEYPSAHGCVTSAVTSVLANVLGTGNIDVTIWGATNGGTTLTTTQHFDTVAQVEEQLPNARVWAGLHWRTSSNAGWALGSAVAAYDLSHFFRPLGNDGGGDNGGGNASGSGNDGSNAGAPAQSDSAAAPVAPDPRGQSHEHGRFADHPQGNRREHD
jgi:hypothetical protein